MPICRLGRACPRSTANGARYWLLFQGYQWEREHQHRGAIATGLFLSHSIARTKN
jgi:hypothetical protein